MNSESRSGGVIIAPETAQQRREQVQRLHELQDAVYRILHSPADALQIAQDVTGMKVCPVCKGNHPPTGDGSGWDGAVFHDPGCPACGGACFVPLAD